VAALQSADEFAGTADQDPVLSTIKPTSTIVPAIIERIMVSLVVCAAPQISAFSSVTHQSRSCRLYWHQSTVVSGVLSCIAKPADGEHALICTDPNWYHQVNSRDWNVRRGF
jgi:hypothetical protein